MQIFIYIAKAFGLMKISEKLGVKNGWLGFIPFANFWLMGQLSQESDVRLRPNKKQRPWGKIYLATSIAYFAVLSAFIVLYISLYIGAILSVFSMGTIFSFKDILGIGVFGIVGICLVGVVLIAVNLVQKFLNLYIDYKIYEVLADKHAPWMVVLTLFFPIAEAILFLVLGLSEKWTPKSSKSAQSPQNGSAPTGYTQSFPEADSPPQSAVEQAKSGQTPFDSSAPQSTPTGNGMQVSSGETAKSGINSDGREEK